VRHPFRRKNLSPRLLPCYLLAGLAFALASPSPPGFAAGLALVCAGEGLRCWGAGHLVKNDRLTVSGPYARLRHPLYAGTLLLALGFALLAGGSALVLVLGAGVPAFFGYYLPYKERVEAARLSRLHGPAYSAYRAAVPSLLPRRARFRPPPGPGFSPAATWSARRLRENSEDGALLGVAVGVGLLALRPLLVS
jgi:hypothetical protein